MRHWKSKEKSPLPAPPFAYHEYEAAFSANYTLSEWQQESRVNRARVVAHYLHKNLRESFTAEAATDKSSSKGGAGIKDGGKSYQSLMKSMGL